MDAKVRELLNKEKSCDVIVVMPRKCGRAHANALYNAYKERLKRAKK